MIYVFYGALLLFLVINAAFTWSLLEKDGPVKTWKEAKHFLSLASILSYFTLLPGALVYLFVSLLLYRPFYKE